MPASLATLPDDPSELKRLLAEQREAHSRELAARDGQIEDLRSELEGLKEQLRLWKKRMFAPSSEAAPGQHTLFDEAETAASATAEPPAEEVEVGGHRRRPRRTVIPPELPRVEQVHELAEDERRCPHDGAELVEIGAETSEELDVVPARIRVIRHIRKKYACRCCEEHVVRAPRPVKLIPKSLASAGLLAEVAVAKYQEALPLYRQEARFARLGIELPRATLAGWMVRIGEALAPVIERLRSELLTAAVIHADETPVQVLKEPGRQATQGSYMWVQAAGQGPPIVLFHYAPSREAAVVAELFGDYAGTVVSDGYAAYGAASGARHAGCWAHARRYFHEALKAQSSARAGKARVGFNEIQRLFRLEKSWKELSPAERLAERRKHASPLIEKLRQWLEHSLPQVAPRTATGKALGYLERQWEKLTRFLDDGAVPIHNNLAENKIRPFVVGRKNWLFSATPGGAHASAALYSVIETAKANGLEPYCYLRWLFERLPTASDVEALDRLLPHRVTADEVVDDLRAALLP